MVAMFEALSCSPPQHLFSTPVPYANQLITLLLFPFRYFGHIDISVTSAAFIVATALLLQRGNPRFSQLSSTMFGLFYCGYLPCFWVMLRCGLSAPVTSTGTGLNFILTN